MIEQVAADLLNGKMKHEVLLKLREGMYEGQTMKYTNDRTANNILLKALKHFKFELQQTKDEMRVLAYNRMLAVYEDAVSVGDRTNALKALDMMNKLYGIEEPQKVDINADDDIRKVNINKIAIFIELFVFLLFDFDLVLGLFFLFITFFCILYTSD